MVINPIYSELHPVEPEWQFRSDKAIFALAHHAPNIQYPNQHLHPVQPLVFCLGYEQNQVYQ